MRYEIILFIFAAFLLAFATGIFLVYLRMLYSRLYMLKKKDFKMGELYEMISQPQGSNFNTAAIASWSLFFVCLGFLFFLTPELFGSYSFLRITSLASSFFGFWLFAFGLILLTIILASVIPKMYSFFDVPVKMKMMIAYVVPFFLLGSLILSADLGTLYPITDSFKWNIAYILMIGGEALLLLPIYSGAGGGLK
jgi:hypothetical protein